MTELAKTESALDVHLAEVLEEYLEATLAGAAPPRAELLARHPELAEQLEACLGSLDFIQRAAVSPSSDEREGLSPPVTSDPGANVAAQALGEQVQLGDYRILREIGRGGMGIVYEAEQPSGRHVALKVLPLAAALDPLQRQRFKNEAQAAALLQHPHIVPVLGVGSERDVNYYVMKYIEGHSLAYVIHELRTLRAAARRQQAARQPDKETGRPLAKGPDVKGEAETPKPGAAATLSASLFPGLSVFHSPGLPFLNESFCRVVAHLGIQGAEALEHAHQAGIIHRDIKPGNLLVDAQGHLWVTDFGLARFQSDAGNLTLSGDLIGTLRYMSPEQALAKHGIVDQRTDIYSLGVTLYELVTLEPAVRGGERQDLLRQIVEEEPCPPRRLNSAMPVALETILLKAIAKQPADRYATAQELADDLKRFLAHQPVVAKRPALAKRAGRWARRHMPVVASAAAVILLALLGLAASISIILPERNEAERRAQQAIQAVDEMYTQVAQRWWYQQPYMEQVQREFLLKALQFYEEFSHERGQAPRWRLESAKAARRVGDIQHKLGEHTTAAQAYDLAIARLTQLVAEFPGEPVGRDELANAHNNHANLLRDTGRLAEAERAYRQAQTLFVSLAAEDPHAPAYRDGLAGSLSNLGMVLHALGRPGDAENAYREAGDVFAGLTRDHPDVPAYGHGQAGCLNNLANLLRDTGRPRAALLAYEQALAVWGKLSSAWPGMPIFRQAQAAGYSGLGVVHAALARTGAAETAHRQALALRDRLVHEYPGVPAYRQALAASQHSLARLFAASGRVQEAANAYTQALALRKNLAKELPAVPAYRQELADSYDGQAALLAAAGRPRQAERGLREAQELRRQLAQELPGTPDAQLDRARGDRALGNVLRDLGQIDGADKLLREAVSQSEKLATAFPAVPAFRLELAAARSDLASLCERAGRLAGAETLHRSALALREKLTADFPDAPYYRLELAGGHNQVAGLFQHTGRPCEAEASCRQAISMGEKLAADFPFVPAYRRLLSRAYEQLGELLIVTGKYQEAEQALEHARPLLDKLLAEFPALPEPRHELARYHHALGLVGIHASRPMAAQAAFQQELALRENLAADFSEETSLALELAHVLANCPDAGLRQPERAAALATKACAASPQDPRARYVLGLAQYRAGAFNKAVEVMEQAEGLAGQYAGSSFVLALAHWQLGNKERAGECYRQGSAWMEQHHPLDEELHRLHGEARTTLGLKNPRKS